MVRLVAKNDQAAVATWARALSVVATLGALLDPTLPPSVSVGR